MVASLAANSSASTSRQLPAKTCSGLQHPPAASCSGVQSLGSGSLLLLLLRGSMRA